MHIVAGASSAAAAAAGDGAAAAAASGGSAAAAAASGDGHICAKILKIFWIISCCLWIIYSNKYEHGDYCGMIER